MNIASGAAKELDVEVAHIEDAPTCLPNDAEGINKETVETCPPGRSAP